jgi:hypothetical protein
LAGLAETRTAFTPEARLFIFVGILGGFTTFSSFGWETLSLARDTQHVAALIDIEGGEGDRFVDVPHRKERLDEHCRSKMVGHGGCLR